MPQDMDALPDIGRAGRLALWTDPAYLPAEDTEARQDLDRDDQTGKECLRRGGFCGLGHPICSATGAGFRARRMQGVAPGDIPHIVRATRSRFVPDAAHEAVLAMAAARPAPFDLPQDIAA